MRFRHLTCLTGFLFLVSSLAGLRAADWPQFHGPKRDNISPDKGLLKKWPKAGPKLLKEISGLGTGYSCPAISGGVIYITGATDKKMLKLSALDKTGKVLWTTLNGKSYASRFPGSRATPTVDGDRLYLLSGVGRVGCFAKKTGKEIWAVDCPKVFGGRGPFFGFAEALLVHKNKVIVTAGGKGAVIVALDKMTGKTLWKNAGPKAAPKPETPTGGRRRRVESAGYCAPIIFTYKGVTQVATCVGPGVVSLDPETGKTLWSVAHSFRCPSTPLAYLGEGRLFATCGYGLGCFLINVTKGKEGFTAKVAWNNYDLDNHHGGVVVLDGLVYGSNHNGQKTSGNPMRGRRPRRGGRGEQQVQFPQGQGGRPSGRPQMGQRPQRQGGKGGKWVCLDLKTGKPKFIVKGVGKGALTYADGMFYCLGERSGVVALVQPTKTGFKEISRFKLGEPDRAWWYWAHPVVLDGRLYLRYKGTLYIYDVKGKRSL